MLQPIFFLECYGQDCDFASVRHGLLEDLPNLERHGSFIKYRLFDGTWIMLLTANPIDEAVFAIECDQSLDLSVRRNKQLARQLLQDIFCSLERRGLRVEYRGGQLTWNE